MLRVHFTFEDCLRCRIAACPDPMWETILSAHLLQNREGAVVFRNWRQHARGRLGDWARIVMTVAPHAPYFPDFLTPAEGTSSLEQGIDAVLSTSPARIHKELALLAAVRRLPGWCRRWADGDLEVARHLGSAIRTYYQQLIQPYWASIQAHVEADRARRSRLFLDSGCAGVLASLGPSLRWRPPILEADYPAERDLYLKGSGLLLVPSFFCWRAPVTLVDPALPPVLVYPVTHQLLGGSPEPFGPRGDKALAALLGATRAAVLCAIESGCTTTELSRRTGISLPSASQHTAVLRDAGLITTQRHGGAVIHSLTPHGSALITHCHPGT